MKNFDSRFEGVRVSAQALCKARKKLPYEVLEYLCEKTCQLKEGQKFNGYEVYALDGTGFCVPDTPELNLHFNKHHSYGSNAYYPQGQLVAAVHVKSKTIKHAMVDCLHGSEKALAECLINNFDKKSIFVLDRGLATQKLLKTIYSNGQQVVARLRTDKQGLKCFQNFAQSLKRQDYTKLNNGVCLRLLKVKIQNYKKPIIIGTTLPESLASLQEIKQIYESRWEIETVYDYIKNLQNLESFHSKSYNGIMQEIFAHFLLHNLTALSHGDEIAEKGQVNRKGMITHFGQRLLAYIILPMKMVKQRIEQILKQMHELAESSRAKQRSGRRYPRISKKPRQKWNEGKHRKKELQRFMALS